MPTFIRSRYQGAGLVWLRPLLATAESEEQLGLAVGVVTNGSTFLRPPSALGSTFERRETAIELTYRVQVMSWLALQPDVHYVINPGNDPALDDGWVVGPRFEVS